MPLLRTSILFVLASVAEIGGGYLVWLWLRSGRSAWPGLLGGRILVLHGVTPTRQRFPHFGRVYAAYGGAVRGALSAVGWGIDGVRPGRFDLLGSLACLAGMGVILYGPRG